MSTGLNMGKISDLYLENKSQDDLEASLVRQFLEPNYTKEKFLLYQKIVQDLNPDLPQTSTQDINKLLKKDPLEIVCQVYENFQLGLTSKNKGLFLNCLEVFERLKNVKSGSPIDKNFPNFKVLSEKEKDSEGSSIVCMSNAKIQCKKASYLVFKIYFDSIFYYLNYPQVEINMYKYVISILTAKNITPNLLRYIYSMPMPTDKLIISNHKEKEKFKVELREIKKFDTENIHVLTLEKSDGFFFDDYLDKNIFDTNDSISIIFQFFYTMECFKRIKLIHNDIHSKNIFIEKQEPPIDIYYEIPSLIQGKKCTLKLTTKYLLKIYDFDMSSIYSKNVPRNTFLEIDLMCHRFNMCPKYSTIDANQFLYNFYTFSKGEVKKFIKTISDHVVFKKLLKLTKLKDKNPFFKNIYKKDFLTVSSYEVLLQIVKQGFLAKTLKIASNEDIRGNNVYKFPPNFELNIVPKFYTLVPDKFYPIKIDKIRVLEENNSASFLEGIKKELKSYDFDVENESQDLYTTLKFVFPEADKKIKNCAILICALPLLILNTSIEQIIEICSEKVLFIKIYQHCIENKVKIPCIFEGGMIQLVCENDKKVSLDDYLENPLL